MIEFIKLLLLILFFLNLNPSQGQILNIERNRVSSFETSENNSTIGSISTQFKIQERGTKLLSAGLEAHFSGILKSTQWMLLSQGSMLYSKVGDKPLQTISNNGYIHFRMNPFFQKTFSPEFFIQSQMDEVRNLKERHLTGAGLRAHFSRKNHLSIVGGTSILYEYEHWVSGDQDAYPLRIKASHYFHIQKQWNNKFDVNSIIYLQEWFKDLSVWRLSWEVNLSLPIHKAWRLKGKFEGMYENSPFFETPKWVYLFTQSISVNIGKHK